MVPEPQTRRKVAVFLVSRRAEGKLYKLPRVSLCSILAIVSGSFRGVTIRPKSNANLPQINRIGAE